MDEFRAEGYGSTVRQSTMAREIREYDGKWDDTDGFAAYIRMLADGLAGESQGWVAVTTLWYVDGDEYLGRLSVRHRLTPELLELGGHIGYGVRPSARRRGHATGMLRASLPVVHGLGIDPVLVTCDVGNTASRRVIEACGGELEDERGGKLRYWIATAG
ncbi:GNAT family N-acetyltransferase [Streptomyces sp. NPDC050610]|uniref:GNAT family N-acetyltransferase n=1 Tax=Streptomyces sp. NPDC050610 TaxID=3157097 RepID=UPI0034417B66